MGANEWINKAKDFATGHKDQVQGALDKAEDAVKSKTGDKYSDKIAKGRGALEDKLGYTEGDESGPAADGPAEGTPSASDGPAADGPAEGMPSAGEGPEAGGPADGADPRAGQ